VPGRYGIKNVKWITRISLEPEDVAGYWQRRGWTDDANIKTMSRIDVPAEKAILTAGEAAANGIAGIAFAGDRDVAKVEVSPDGGDTWQEAVITNRPGPLAWVLWHLPWTPQPGTYRQPQRPRHRRHRRPPARRGGATPARRRLRLARDRRGDRLMPDYPGLNRFAAHGHHRLAYELVPAEQDETPAIVLLHGLLAGRGEWADQRAGLAGSYTLVLPEARGHGASAALSDRGYSLDEAAAETIAVFDHAELGAVHLVGHGLGGAVAWETARRAPARVITLTLVEPDLPALLDGALDPLAGSVRREDRTANRAAVDAAYKGLVDQALDLYLSPRRGADWRTRLPRPVQATYRRHVAALPALLDALDAHVPAPGDLPPALPILVVRGSESRPFVQLIAEQLVAGYPDARIETVPTTSPDDSPLVDATGEALTTLLRRFVGGESG
jgi:pimeloyl-ACP methyl ester carboxylesterase